MHLQDRSAGLLTQLKLELSWARCARKHFGSDPLKEPIEGALFKQRLQAGTTPLRKYSKESFGYAVNMILDSIGSAVSIQAMPAQLRLLILVVPAALP